MGGRGWVLRVCIGVDEMMELMAHMAYMVYKHWTMNDAGYGIERSVA